LYESITRADNKDHFANSNKLHIANIRLDEQLLINTNLKEEEKIL